MLKKNNVFLFRNEQRRNEVIERLDELREEWRCQCLFQYFDFVNSVW